MAAIIINGIVAPVVPVNACITRIMGIGLSTKRRIEYFTVLRRYDNDTECYICERFFTGYALKMVIMSEEACGDWKLAPDVICSRCANMSVIGIPDTNTYIMVTPRIIFSMLARINTDENAKKKCYDVWKRYPPSRLEDVE